MARSDSDCSSGEREDSDLSDDDSSLLYRNGINTRLRPRWVPSLWQLFFWRICMDDMRLMWWCVYLQPLKWCLNRYCVCRKEMSFAQWDATRGTAEVVVRKGKAWTTTGFTRGSLHLTFIEEAVWVTSFPFLITRAIFQHVITSCTLESIHMQRELLNTILLVFTEGRL